MAEYISKDDAKSLIAVLDKQTYTLPEAKKFISIKDRLQKYIDDPDTVQTDVKPRK